MGMCRHGQTAWETPGMGKGVGKWTKAQAVAWACTVMDKGMRMYEMGPRVQVRCR